MGIGHVSVAFATKRLAPGTSLGLLMLASLFIDALWGLVTIPFGLEHARIQPGITEAFQLDLYDYPITHSAVGSLFWAAVFGGIYYAVRRTRPGAGTAALVLAAGVFSHWVLDVVAHRPDMPVLPGGPSLGLGLWRSLPATVIVEAAMLLGGVALYARATRARDGIGAKGLIGLVAFLLLAHLGGYLGPPPPSMAALTI